MTTPRDPRSTSRTRALALGRSPLAMGVLSLAMGGVSCTIEEKSPDGQLLQSASVAQALLVTSDAINRKWLEVGVAVLGNPTSATLTSPDGAATYVTFEHGVIVDSTDHGPHLLSRPIFDRWIALASETNKTSDGDPNLLTYVGPPTDDYSSDLLVGDQANFARGTIVARLTFGPPDSSGIPTRILHEPILVYGRLYERFKSLDWLRLGRPVAEETDASDGGRYQVFEKSELHWHSSVFITDGIVSFDAHAVIEPVLGAWKNSGGVAGPLGPPTDDTTLGVTPPPEGTEYFIGRFKEGVIYKKGQLPAVALQKEYTPDGTRKNDLLLAYETQYGGPGGPLGFPKSNPETRPMPPDGSGDTFINLEHGVLIDHESGATPGPIAFSRLQLYVDRVQGEGTDQDNSPLDIWTIVSFTSKRGDTVVRYYSDRWPHEGDSDDDNVLAIAQSFDLDVEDAPGAEVSSDFTVEVNLHAEDEDHNGDDDLGTAHALYSIDNLWGNDGSSNQHHAQGEDHSMDAYFRLPPIAPCPDRDLTAPGSPPENPKECSWWSFHNFKNPDTSLGNPELNYAQYAKTFVDVQPDEQCNFDIDDIDLSCFAHPFNEAYYHLFFKGNTKTGNCVGMSIESIYADIGRSPYPQPLYKTIHDHEGEPLRITDDFHASLMDDLNVKHSYQLGDSNIFWTLGMTSGGFTHDPKYTFIGSLNNWNAGDPPVITMTDYNLFGRNHTVRPYKWVRDAANHQSKIYVRDPNRPFHLRPDEDFIEISDDNSYVYRDPTSDHSFGGDFDGGEWTGGRIFYTPFHVYDHRPHTPGDRIFQLIEGGFVLMIAGSADVNQVSDDAGRTFFETSLQGAPARWDGLRRDAERIPNFAPVIIGDAVDIDAHIYAGKGVGATHHYDFMPKPGAPAGKRYLALFDSAKLSSYAVIPGTAGQADTFTAEKIGEAAQALSVALPAAGQAKEITWVVAGAEKTHWVQLSGLFMSPAQKITARLGHAGESLNLDNNGPSTTARLFVKPRAGMPAIDMGMLPIPTGSSTLDVQRPITTLAVAGEVPGKNGWLVAPVTVTLTARDLSGKGVAAIEYSRDQNTWTTYTGPFVYGDEGSTVLYYRARDNGFNQEAPKSQAFKIDTRQPGATGSVSTTSGVKLAYAVADPNPGSGPAGVHTVVKGASGPIEGFAAGTSGTLTLPTTCSAVEMWGEDVAGNLQSPHVTIADSVKPVFTAVPPAVESSHCTVAGGLVLVKPTATDDCGVVSSIESDAPTKFPLGTTLVTWTAKDPAGNEAKVTQKVTVFLDDDASCCPAGTIVIKGGSGNDTLTGTISNECILGLGGNDTIEGGGGFDFIAGGSGDDNITGGASRDYIWGGAGRDVIDGRGGDDFIDGGKDADNCSGGTGTNAILACETKSFCNAACCSTNTCSIPPPPALGCQTAYAQSSCGSYVLHTTVSKSGHNWECTNGNCSNCATFSSCVPGASGCPWGVVWTDRGACP